ncbi:MAG: ABC transporter permease subunit [Bacteroidales bacterium]|nr:ABC transporter permease subunit [Bacteroidales bacterium]
MRFIERLYLLICLLSVVACHPNVQESLPVYEKIEDLYGKKVGALTGCFQEELLEKEYPELEVLRIDNITDMMKALSTRKCESAVFDDYSYFYYSASLKDLTLLSTPLITADMGACFQKGKSTELRDSFNEFLKVIKADGTYDDIYNRWMYHADEYDMPEIDLPKEGKPLRVAVNSTAPPLEYIRNGKLVGMEVELGNRFAAYIGRPIVWTDMNFSAMIPALVSGTQDMVISAVNITPQRQKSVDFSDPYFTCSSVVAIRSENSAGYTGEDKVEKTGIWAGIKDSFRRNIIEENRYQMIWSGFKLTALISLLAGLFGTLSGGLICWMRMCRYSILRRFAGFYISLMRGTPVLVLLMIMFYVVFASSTIDGVVVSIITFGMNFGAYVSEMFRSSIESVDKGQTEAGIAMGFTPVKTFLNIVLPQAFKQVLPVYKGELISLVKTTSIVGYIAVQDLTKVGDIIRSRTFDAFFPLLMVAVLYFILSWMFAALLDFIGKKTLHF